MTTDATVDVTRRLADMTVPRIATAPPHAGSRRALPRVAALSVVTPLGWSVLVLGIGALIAGAALGWAELLIAATMCVGVLLIAVGFVVVRASLRTEVELDPPRLVAGERALGRLRFANSTGWRSVPVEVELPVGHSIATFRIPTLAPGAGGDEVFVIPTERRGVIDVGPPTTVRSDPLGLLTRRALCGARGELLVHPVTTALPMVGVGLLRDLEGLTTTEVSPSDLAFHSLREYVPGDDLRFIHWRSVARTGRLQVRQFNDTRRSSMCVIADSRAAAYPDPEDFELALQAAGSLMRRAVADGLRTSFAGGGQYATSTTAFLLLDALARAELRAGADGLAHDAARAAKRGTDMTLAVLISGSNVAPFELHRAARWFPPEVRTVAIRVVPGEAWAAGSAGGTTLIQIGSLRDLVTAVSAGAIR